MVDQQNIIQQFKNGEKSAFEHIFRQYFVRLCIYAQNIIRSKEVAEEVVEDLFLFLWENCGDINITGSLSSYLYRSVHNRCVKYLKHMEVEKKYLEKQQNIYLDRDSGEFISTDYPVANLISKELEQSIEKAIQSLPEQCREVFIQNRIYDHSYLEIAEMLKISVNTVKTQMARALQKLRTELKEYLPLIFFIAQHFILQD